jgi:beta-lactamase superfamily II metal-dependent hydrolase
MPTGTAINRVSIHMYRMGTGDCFVVKFLKNDAVDFKMLIDCGCWNGSEAKLTPYIEQLRTDVEDHIDVLVVTHEHKDHVLGFERCKELFQALRIDQIWMAWTEKDGDPKVTKWKKEYGQRRLALLAAAERVSEVVTTQAFKDQLAGSRDADGLHARRQNFAGVLQGFADLHASKEYAGELAGMAVVKNDIANDNTSYFGPGDVMDSVPGLEGVRIFVLGPPRLYSEVKVEKGPKGEAYDHNDQLEDTNEFAAAFTAVGDQETIMPFDASYVSSIPEHRKTYDDPDMAWRRIDYDWLFSAGSLALRMNTQTNNLSLVLAIEFVESGKVLLFPGDAEFGSWKSWHKIDWESKVPGLTTEKLLNRVVFYKVAHHLSHNGTAKSIGLDLMISSDLVAMATLDYDVIPDGWTTTMPNVGILKDLLEKTKGRTLIMNTKGLLFDRSDNVPLEPKIDEYRKRLSAAERQAFEEGLEVSQYYTGITIKVQ